MKFVLAVHSASDPHANRFAEAAVKAGHEISLVFFYQDGIQAADREQTDGERWQQLAAEHAIPLAVCIGAAARRELLDESAPASSGRVRQGFEVVGLGQYIGALVEADRLITFAGDR